VVFATHYLEEADAYADRVVLMAHGRVVADGPTGEIKSRVGSRTIRATLPGADPVELELLPGVIRAERHEIVGAGLEQAFVELTSDDATERADREEVLV
jgi:ABC-2 type transport system ATP-binding protein